MRSIACSVLCVNWYKQSAKFSLNWRITDSLDWRLDGNWIASQHRNIADVRLPVDDFF